MTRPYFDTGLYSLTRLSQRQPCVSTLGLSHASVSSRGPSSGRSLYVSSRSGQVPSHGSVAAAHAAAAFPVRNSSWQQERKQSNASGSHAPPFSLSHMQAATLAAENSSSFRFESRGILDGLMNAFERHVLHAEPSGNFRLPLDLLHVGECPEVPEHLGTFALRRSGSLHFLQQAEEETEGDEGTTPSNSRLKRQSKPHRPRKRLARHVSGEARLACSCCSKQEPHAEETGSCCCELGASHESSTSCSSGSSGSTSGDTPRAGGLRRTFSWQRLRGKLRR